MKGVFPVTNDVFRVWLEVGMIDNLRGVLDSLNDRIGQPEFKGISDGKVFSPLSRWETRG